MRIAHFSDIHAGSWIRGMSGYFDKRLLGAFNFLLRRKLNQNWNFVDLAVQKIKQIDPDIVICTGDIATIASNHEFTKAKDALTPLVEDTRFEFLFIPGNHDAYINNRKCIKNLNKTFRFLNRDRFDLDDLPRMHTFKGTQFLLVDGATPGPFYSSAGVLTKDTQASIQQYLSNREKNQKLILIGHFPLFDKSGNPLSWRRRCHGNTLLQESLTNGAIDLSLCGHIHQEFARWEEKGSLEVSAGSLTNNGRINIIDFPLESNKIEQKWINLGST